MKRMPFAAPALLVLSLALVGAGRAGAEAPRTIGSRLELFVDHYLIDTMAGTELRLNHPVDAGVAFAFNAPWEGTGCNYVSMIKDGPIYRCYYRAKPEGSKDGEGETTCMAESRDGIHWTKPDLGLFGHNNEVWAEPIIAQNFTPFIDTRPGVPAAERYKALGGLFGAPDSGHGYWALVSPDGIHWRKLQEKPVIDRSNYPMVRVDDSANPAFWFEPEHCYVALVRAWADSGHPGYRGKAWADDGTVRAVGRLTSPDFIHWSKLTVMGYNGAPLEQLYNNTTHPYFRAPHILIATPPRIVFDRPNVTPEEAAAIQVSVKQSHDSSEPVLMTSRGGNQYDRTFMEAFIRNDIGPGNWTSRDNYPAISLLPTGDHEMSLYTVANYAQPNCHLERFVLPLDRFASVYGPYAGGEFTTKTLTFTGRALHLNFSTSVAGGIRIELQDASGRPIPGYTLADSIELTGNAIERPAAWKTGATATQKTWHGDVSETTPNYTYTFWKGGEDLSRLAGTPIRIRFVMKEADLYALRFR